MMKNYLYRVTRNGEPYSRKWVSWKEAHKRFHALYKYYKAQLDAGYIEFGTLRSFDDEKDFEKNILLLHKKLIVIERTQK